MVQLNSHVTFLSVVGVQNKDRLCYFKTHFKTDNCIQVIVHTAKARLRCSTRHETTFVTNSITFLVSSEALVWIVDVCESIYPDSLTYLMKSLYCIHVMSVTPSYENHQSTCVTNSRALVMYENPELNRNNQSLPTSNRTWGSWIPHKRAQVSRSNNLNQSRNADDEWRIHIAFEVDISGLIPGSEVLRSIW